MQNTIITKFYGNQVFSEFWKNEFPQKMSWSNIVVHLCSSSDIFGSFGVSYDLFSAQIFNRSFFTNFPSSDESNLKNLVKLMSKDINYFVAFVF